jgi:hypothetical protein
MKNYWLRKTLRTGKQVKYKGLDKDLNGKIGKILAVWGEWIDVEFEIMMYKMVQKRVVSVERDSLEIV